MSLKHLPLLQEDDDDPMLSAVNLVDVFLVLVVALLTAVAAHGSASSKDKVTIIRNEGRPDMEIIVREDGREVRFKGEGQVGAAQGERTGVAYRLKDGRIVYVPEVASAASAASAGAPEKGPQP
jgi:hypothetical protein